MLKKLVATASVAWLLGSFALAKDTANQPKQQETNATTPTKGASSGTISATSKNVTTNTGADGVKSKVDTPSSIAIDRNNTPGTPAITTKQGNTPVSNEPAETSQPGKQKKHHRIKHAKGTQLDGEPMSQIGAKKRVDRGFDFDNSQQFGTSSGP